MCWKYSHKMFCEIIKQLVPERALEIENIVQKNNITFVADETLVEIKFSVDKQGVVKIYTQALNRFWAHTYAYYALYDYIQNNGWENYVNFGDSEQNLQASKLLEWAVNSDRNPYDPNIKYPDGAPLPFEISDENCLSICARDITIFGLGYILLHEIAHIELKHAFNADEFTSIQQEYEADKWAAHFVMDCRRNYIEKFCPSNPSAHNIVDDKRLLALVASNYWLVKAECYNSISKNKTHPPTFERLNAIIEEFVSDDNHLLWAMSVLVLCLHLQQFHPNLIINRNFSTYKECTQYYMNCISNNIP